MSRVLIVGNLTLDRLSSNERRAGGPGLYGGIALRHLDVEVFVYSCLPRECSEPISSSLSAHGIKLIAQSCEKMPSFEITYSDDSRTLKVISTGERLNRVIDVVRGVRPSLVIFSPVLNEVDPHDVLKAKTLGSIVVVDIQGFVRVVGSDGVVAHEWRDSVDLVVSCADLVHCDLSEVPQAAGDALKAVEYFLNRSQDKVITITLGSRGSYAVVNGSAYYIPTLNVMSVDNVGTGDIFTAVASYLIYVRREDVIASLVKASIASALKTVRVRPPWYTAYELDVLADELMGSVRIVARSS